ncbi:hypothetical protein [Rhodanobacter soli]|uniref:hypothetical protein n=1 Tax=Rhodanobacter soli TaxID=590609 RepID=UPI0031DA22A8
MNPVLSKFSHFLALAVLPVAASLAHAQEPPMAHWPAAVSGHCLDAVRGGFDFGNGLLASFGIERAVYINGNLVTSNSVQVPDIGRMTPDQATALAAATGTVNVIRNGAGNSVDTSAFNQMTAATVIQNSLDNQDIRSLTMINVGVNSQIAFRSLNLQQSLQAGLIGSLGH